MNEVIDRPSERIERGLDVDVGTRNECWAEDFVERDLEDSDWLVRYLMTSSSEVLLPFVMVKTAISVCDEYE